MDSNGLYSSTSSTDAQQRLASFWNTMNEDINGVHDFKTQELPLARIKKIMKMDGEVKMISAEAPVLFAKAAEIFINELSLRAWIHTEDNKRRTLQRNDIAMAVAKYDQFDFLIDIVPRDELKPQKRTEGMGGVVGGPEIRTPNTDQVQYYFQLANPVSTTNSNSSPSIQSNTASAQQVAVAPPQSVQATPTLQLQPTQTVMQAVGLQQQQQQGTVSQSTNSMSQNATRTNTSTVDSAVGVAANQQQGQPQQQQQLYNMTTLRFNSQPINYNNRAPNALQEYQPSYSNQMSYLQGPQVYNSNQTSYQGNQQNRNSNQD